MCITDVDINLQINPKNLFYYLKEKNVFVAVQKMKTGLRIVNKSKIVEKNMFIERP